MIKSNIFEKLARKKYGDLIGGATGTAIALPQSMAFGMIVFNALGMDAASGALAGLLGAAILSFCSGLVGATSGLISAPNGPVTMLLIASIYDIASSGVESAMLLPVLMLIMVLAGLIQIILGFTLGGHLVKYIPFPVISGLVTGIGLLMIWSQLKLLTTASVDRIDSFLNAVPLIIAAITFLSIHQCSRIWPRFPSILGGLIFGVLCFQLLNMILPNPVPFEWVVGELPSFNGLYPHMDWAGVQDLPWYKLITAAIVIALLASIDCLLTAVVADGQTGNRHDSRRELIVQGVGHILVGLLGAIGGGGTKGSTLVAIDSGARRWAGVVCAIVIFSLILFAGSTGMYLPTSVLAGVIVYVGINMIDTNILSWLRYRRLRVDVIVALAVISSTLIYSLLMGLGIGLVCSILLYIRSQVVMRVIHERATGKNQRSLQERTDVENRLLDEHGNSIIYVELRGNLFFGNVDRLFNELLADLEWPVWIVINMRRVQQIDSSAVHLLGQMAQHLQKNGGTMLYSNIMKHSGGFKKIDKAFSQLGSVDCLSNVKTFPSTDAALQFAEDSLLRSIDVETAASKAVRVKLEDNRLLTNLDKNAIKILSKVLKYKKYSKNKILFSPGDPGQSIYLIISGEAEVRLPIGRYHYKCVARIGPGNYLGGTTFLHKGRRSTMGIVNRSCEVMVLDRAMLKKLTKKGENDTVVHILESIAITVARQLYWTREELTRLEKA